MKKEYLKIGNIPALLYGAKSEKLYIFVHGRYGKKEDADNFAAIVVDAGYQVLSFDLPEHGERANEEYRCTIQNGIHDLKEIYSFAQNKYKRFSLFACSLGAYFSLSAYQDVDFEKCLFLSPVVDMKRLIENMMRGSNVSEEVLREKSEIETTFGETLSWDYYEFVRNNPIKEWNSKTFILYGENDNITEKDIIENFAEKYNCDLEIVPNGEHWFHTAEQLNCLENWIRKHG